MTRFPIALSLALLLLAGCGAKSAQQSSGTSAPATAPAATVAPVPTTGVPPTPVITGGSVAATVNGQPIPMRTYRELVVFLQRRSAGQPGATTKAIAAEAMKNLIAFEIIREYAAAHGITLSSQELDAEIASEQRTSGGPAKFQAQLAKFGLTMDVYRTIVQLNLLGTKVQNALFPLKTTIAPAAHVRHILIGLQPANGRPARTDAQAKTLANQILAQLHNGWSFASLAEKYSDDPGSASKGGDLGNIFHGDTVPPFDKAAFSLPLHHPAVIHSTYGYHVVEVLWRGKATHVLPGQQQLQQQKFSAWATQQEKGAKIKQFAKVA